MKKILLTLLSALFVLTMNARPAGAGDETDQPLLGIVETLSKVEGYVFITKEESRNLLNTFTRTDEVFSGEDVRSLASMSWYIYNEGVATVLSNGELYGRSYGNTLMRVTDHKKNEDHYYIVFVTPTITVVTPEGSVFTHQKIHGEKARLKLSQSQDYVINCVMLRDQEKIYDITDRVVMHDNDNDGMGYGEYISTNDITSDVTLTVTLQSRDAESSAMRIQVDGMKVSFLTADTGIPFGGLMTTITSLNGQVVYKERLPQDAVVVFNDDVTGVYFINFDELPDLGTFKIVTRHND